MRNKLASVEALTSVMYLAVCLFYTKRFEECRHIAKTGYELHWDWIRELERGTHVWNIILHSADRTHIFATLCAVYVIADLRLRRDGGLSREEIEDAHMFGPVEYVKNGVYELARAGYKVDSCPELKHVSELPHMIKLRKIKKHLDPDYQYVWRCESCGSDYEKIKTCSRCGIYRYCSRGCQKTDWKKQHKQQCGYRQPRSPYFMKTNWFDSETLSTIV